MSTSGQKCFLFTWIIENFSYCWQKKGERIISPSFIVETMERTKWNLWLYPAGGSDDKHISLFLHRLEDSKGSCVIKIEFEFSLLAENESPLKSTSVFNSSFCKGSNCWGLRKFEKIVIIQLQKVRYLPKDTLTVCCKIWSSTGIMKQDGRCVARTRIGIERRSFVWTVKQFSSLGSKVKNIYTIRSTTEDELIMTLDLFTQEVIRLDLSASNRNLIFHFQMSIVNAFGYTEEIIEREYRFSDCLLKSLEFPFHLTKKRLISKKDFYLPNDELILKCECAFSTENAASEIESTSYGYISSLMENVSATAVGDENKKSGETNTSKETFKYLYTEQLFSDTKLKTRTQTFPAHKCILGARSPVFRAMFTNDMREKVSECISIEDLDDDTVQRMLLYMYTDELEGLQWESARGLYAAADKYEILSLKKKCSSFLMANFCPLNACEVLILADMHSDDDLKTAVQDFILRHDKDIINSDAWKQLMKTHLNLAADTMLLKFM
ncbi:speckle-type POZ protein B [Nephila pilipes]|uniref:Speckle-type POZ protein B n=1 Tax=Nephila pilipes TaxID=299642 RepID=A0A8X6N5Q2_NEPPI|nr:speckle-type POZ protein B [Nephila pilipes]